jgi:hypothetical protein
VIRWFWKDPDRTLSPQACVKLINELKGTVQHSDFISTVFGDIAAKMTRHRSRGPAPLVIWAPVIVNRGNGIEELYALPDDGESTRSGQLEGHASASGSLMGTSMNSRGSTTRRSSRECHPPSAAIMEARLPSGCQYPYYH